MDDVAILAKEKMNKSIANLKETYKTLRTGRASAAILDNIECDYYGDKMLINQISAIKVPEPRQLLITPFDKSDVKSIVAAINASDIGINPVVDGNSIRLVFPALTEDRRKELAKKSKTYSEETKVSIRNIRRDAIDSIKKDTSYTEDLRKRAEEDVQKVTDEAVKEVELIAKEKEKEIMSL